MITLIQHNSHYIFKAYLQSKFCSQIKWPRGMLSFIPCTNDLCNVSSGVFLSWQEPAIHLNWQQTWKWICVLSYLVIKLKVQCNLWWFEAVMQFWQVCYISTRLTVRRFSSQQVIDSPPKNNWLKLPPSGLGPVLIGSN